MAEPKFRNYSIHFGSFILKEHILKQLEQTLALSSLHQLNRKVVQHLDKDLNFREWIHIFHAINISLSSDLLCLPALVWSHDQASSIHCLPFHYFVDYFVIEYIIIGLEAVTQISQEYFIVIMVPILAQQFVGVFILLLQMGFAIS